MKRLVISTIIVLAASLAQSQVTQVQVPQILDTNIRVPQVFDIGGSGARARGMGSAYLASGEDASALTFNPAGLFSIDKTMMTFGLDQFASRGSVTFGASSTPQSGSFGGLGFFSLVTPFRVKGHGFVGGLSYGRTSDEASNASYKLIFPIDPDGIAPTLDTTNYFLDVQRNYHAYFVPVTIGFGTRLSEKLAGGLSLAIITGRSVDRISQQDHASNWFVFEKYPQGVEYQLRAAAIDTSSYSGVTVSLGFKYMADKSSFGFMMKLPYTLRQKTNRTLRATTYVNGLEYTNASGVIFRDGNVIDIDIPMTVGFGGAYKPDTNTTLAADIEYRPFSGKNINIRDSLRLVPGAKDEEFFRSKDPGWRNVFVIRTGAEKILSTSSLAFPRVPVRAGIGIMPIPAPNTTNGEPTGTATSMSLSLGSGVWWSLLHLDVAYTYRALKQTEATAFGSTEAKGKGHLLYLTFTGYF